MLNKILIVGFLVGIFFLSGCTTNSSYSDCVDDCYSIKCVEYKEKGYNCSFSCNDDSFGFNICFDNRFNLTESQKADVISECFEKCRGIEG